MALMAVAAGAAGLDADHAIGGVADRRDVSLVDRRPERRPAGAAFELGLVQKQRQPTQAAAVDAVLLLAKQAAAERRLGAMAQQHVGLFRRERRLQCAALVFGGRGEVEA